MKPLAIVALASVEATAAPCAKGTYLEQLERTGPDAAVACFVGQGGTDRSCWRVDGKGVATALPQAQWPAPAPPIHEPKGDRLEPVLVDNVRVTLPAGMTVTFDQDDIQAPRRVEICEGKACRRLTLRAQKRERTSLHAIESLYLLPDKHTLFVGLGAGAAPGSELLERYDLDRPAQQAETIGTCRDVLGVVSGNVLVQTTDCANAGGERLLMTPAGKQLAKLGHASMKSPYYALGGDRYVLAGYTGEMAVWDLAKGKRLAATENPHESVEIVVFGNRILAVAGGGAITSYDAALAPTKLPGIPRCTP